MSFVLTNVINNKNKVNKFYNEYYAGNPKKVTTYTG